MGFTPEFEEPAKANGRYAGAFWGVMIVLTTVIVALALAIGAFGVAVQRRVVAPPELDVNFGGLHMVAFTTNDPACADNLLCAPDHIAVSTQDYYAVWVLHTAAGYSTPIQVGRRVFVMAFGDEDISFHGQSNVTRKP